APRGQPEGVDEFRRVGHFENHQIVLRERAGLELVHPVGRVHALDIRVGGGFRAKEIIGEGDAVFHQLIGDQAVFLRGKDVRAQVEIVEFVVDELEGQHERLLWRSSLFLVFCEKPIPHPLRGIGMTKNVYTLPRWGRAMLDPYTESVFAFEDEIGKREQRACIFGVAMAVEASFGTARVNEGQAARTVQSAGIAHQGDKFLRLHGMEFLFFEYARDQFARLAVAIFHGVDQRQRDFAFFQIAEHRLAELLAGSGEVEKVVHKLEGQTGIAPIFREGLFVLVAQAAQHATEPRAAAEEAGGFVGGQFQGIFLGHIHAADLGKLQEFAFDHFLGEINQDVEHMEIAFFEGNLKGLHVEPIAGEDAAVIAPAGIRRRAATARVGAVNHVVMNECGAVKELDDGGQANGAARFAAASGGVAVTKQEQRGAQALSAAAQQIARDFRNRLKRRGTLAGQLLLDLHEVDAHQFKNLFGRENCDDWPPATAALIQRDTAGGAVPDRVSGKNRRKFTVVARATSSSGKSLT